MWIENVDEVKRELAVAIPLTNATGKTRIKTRSFFNEYGFPIATRSNPFTQSCYDVVIAEAEKFENATLKDSNINIFVLMLKIFGTLTENHNKDIVMIIVEMVD